MRSKFFQKVAASNHPPLSLLPLYVSVCLVTEAVWAAAFESTNILLIYHLSELPINCMCKICSDKWIIIIVYFLHSIVRVQNEEIKCVCDNQLEVEYKNQSYCIISMCWYPLWFLISISKWSQSTDVKSEQKLKQKIVFLNTFFSQIWCTLFWSWLLYS